MGQFTILGKCHDVQSGTRSFFKSHHFWKIVNFPGNPRQKWPKWPASASGVFGARGQNGVKNGVSSASGTFLKLKLARWRFWRVGLSQILGFRIPVKMALDADGQLGPPKQGGKVVS